MAAQEESPFRGLMTSWPALAAVGVTMFSFLSAMPRLDSPRPADPALAPKFSATVGELPARLWQDPLGAVIQGPLRWDDDLRSNRDDFVLRMPRRDPDFPEREDKVLVILTLIETEMHGEQIENRRRERYATLSALNTAGYVPVTSEFMSYMDLWMSQKPASAGRPNPYSQGALMIPAFYRDAMDEIKLRKETSADKPSFNAKHARTPFRVPFEWARPLKKGEVVSTGAEVTPAYRGVCVVWVYEDNDLDNPLLALNDLKDVLTETLRGPDQKGPACDFAITGRITSSRLEAIRAGDKELKEESIFKNSMSDVKLYVTYSTAQLVRGQKSKKALPNDDPVSRKLSHTGLQFEYVIGTDLLLMKSLVKELESRSVRMGMTNGRIAIISESDTLYGRAMHQEFLKAAGFEKEIEKPGADEKIVYKPKNVFLYSYLRGLDGKLAALKPDAAPATDKEAGKSDKPRDPSDKPTAANGEGDAQIDYLRRLIERMKAGHKQFRAIGVLGNDVYDKLLILRALRASFPEAIFFTTDLDARMLQPAELDGTRNLLIASHFGLSLKEGLQAKIPPFRSSYDTASYLGCLLAVRCPLLFKVADQHLPEDPTTHRHLLELQDKHGKRCDVAAPVHLYQVGRYGAFELTSYESKDDPLGPPNSQRKLWYFEGRNWWKWIGLPSVLVLVGIMLWPVSQSWQRFLRDIAFWRPGQRMAPRHTTVILGIVFLALVTGVISYSHLDPDQEPFSMVDGISVWPTVLFRALAIVLCFYYTFKVLHELGERDKQVIKDFFPPPSEQAPPAAAVETAKVDSGLWAFLCRAGAMWLWPPTEEKADASVQEKPEPKPEEVKTLWEQFEEHGRISHRVGRCALIVLGALGLFAFFWFLFEHQMFWGRGRIARYAVTSTLFVSGVMLIVLLAFVVDATVLCNRFIRSLVRGTREWPEPLLDRTGLERGLYDAANEPTHTALGQLMTVRLIAATTDVVAQFIYFPFVVLLVLLVAQSPLFEPWHWNSPLIAMVVLCAGAALTCAAMFQKTARDAQTKALAALDVLLLPTAGHDEDITRKKLLQVRAEIEGIRSGAFAGYTQNPIVYALMLPLAGGGGLAALSAFLPHM